MARLLRHLLLIAILLLSPAGHGAAMARGTQPLAAPAGMQVHAMHHGGDVHCGAGRHCPRPGQADWCCMIGHCLLAVMAEGAAALPAFRPALPLPGNASAALAAPPGAPERPPRIA